jgi:hypothetical protein
MLAISNHAAIECRNSGQCIDLCRPQTPMIKTGTMYSILSLILILALSQGCGGGFSSGPTQAKTTDLPGDDPNSPNPSTPPVPSPPPSGNSSLQAFDVGAIYTVTRYVSASGNEANSGTRASPYRTVQRAMQGATQGTEVVLLAGTYPALGNVSNLTGTMQNPIKIRGEGEVIVNATAGPTGLSMSDPRYVVIENLIIQNSPIHGMNIDDGGSYATPGEYLVLREIDFRNIGSGNNNDCLKISGINRFHIEGGSFENCNMGEAIDMVGCHDGIVTGNLFRNIPQHAVQAKGGSENILFHGNIFRDIAGHALNLGGSTDPTLFRPITATSEGIRIRAVANIIERALAPAAFIACRSCEFTQNTVISPNRWPIRILQGGSDGQSFPSRDGFVYNNIFVFQSSRVSTFVNIGVGTNPETFSFANNLWFSTDNANFAGPNLGEAGPELNSIIQQNPNFRNLAGGDYRLQTGSSAIAVGRVLPTPAPGDFTGRSYNTPPSLGAFEVE